MLKLLLKKIQIFIHKKNLNKRKNQKTNQNSKKLLQMLRK